MNNNRKATQLTNLEERVEEDGFAIGPTCLEDETRERPPAIFADGKHVLRNLLSMPIVRELAASMTSEHL